MAAVMRDLGSISMMSIWRNFWVIGVALRLLDEGEHQLAVDVQVDEGGGGALGAHQGAEVLLLHRHALVAGLAVDDRRDGALEAEATGGAAAVDLAAGDVEAELLHRL